MTTRKEKPVYPKYNKWTTEGMTEREMISRIKSHEAMAWKAAQRAHANTLPDAFFGTGFENYLRDNPKSPWVDKRMDYETKKVAARRTYTEKRNVMIAIGKSLEHKRLKKLQYKISKLGQGY